MIGHDGQVDDGSGVHVALLHHRIVRVVRELAADGIYLLEGVDGRRVGVSVEIQLESHPGAARGGAGGNVLHIGYRGERVFHGLRDLLLHRFRVGAVVIHADDHIGRIDIRIELHADAPVAVEPQHHEEEHDHEDAHGVRHGVMGQIELLHSAPPLTISASAPSRRREIFVTATRSPSDTPERISIESSLISPSCT